MIRSTTTASRVSTRHSSLSTTNYNHNNTLLPVTMRTPEAYPLVATGSTDSLEPPAALASSSRMASRGSSRAASRASSVRGSVSDMPEPSAELLSSIGVDLEAGSRPVSVRGSPRIVDDANVCELEHCRPAQLACANSHAQYSRRQMPTTLTTSTRPQRRFFTRANARRSRRRTSCSLTAP
jgi:hypothetical protein